MNGMGNKKSLLSICIPTYNRAEILKECLEDLQSIINDYNINILILDNASTDKTQEVASMYNNIEYIRNDENIGGDLNILKSYQIASTKSEYICVLGDSYRFSSNIGELIDILKTQLYDLVVLNRRYKILESNQNTCYSDINKFLMDLGGIMDLVGTIVIRSEAIKSSNYSHYTWGNFIHVGMAFNYLSTLENPRCYFLYNLSLVHTKKDKLSTSWYNKSFEIFAKNWTLTILSLPGNVYSNDSKLDCIAKHDFFTGCFSFRRLLYLRSKKMLFYRDLSPYVKFIPFVTKTPLLLIILISITPIWIIRSLKFIRNLLR